MDVTQLENKGKIYVEENSIKEGEGNGLYY